MLLIIEIQIIWKNLQLGMSEKQSQRPEDQRPGCCCWCWMGWEWISLWCWFVKCPTGWPVTGTGGKGGDGFWFISWAVSCFDGYMLMRNST
jgi:hypothetical protein